jgi:flagellar protein FliO/FliZ
MTGKTQKIVLVGLAGLAAVLLLAMDPASAAEEATSGGYLSGYENTDPRPTTVSLWSTAAYLLSLFAIFAFVVGMAYFVAKYLGGHFAKQQAGNGGRVLSHLPLGPNRSVCVVEMAGRCLLLGVTEHQITLLSEITDPGEIERLEHDADDHPVRPELFAKQFGTLGDFVQKIPPMFRK